MTTRQPTPISRPDTPREQCADCGAALVEDQRYCLQCGARRGKPRIDFTAFWKRSSPTRAQDEPGDAQGARMAPWFDRGAPSRRVAGALAGAVLAAGIAAGIALGPGPASSPVDSLLLAQRALGALAAQTGDGSGAGASTSSATVSVPAATVSTTSHKAEATSQRSSGKASAPAASEGSSSAESATSTPSSEGSSPEGASSKDSGEGEKTSAGTPVKLPPIKRVWVISLSGESLSAALANPTIDPYLVKQVIPKGTLLSGYTLASSSELANGIGLLSGQGVNLDTEQNCPTYAELQPATVNATNGLAEGVGCVYPAAVKTLADELTAAGMTWKAYVQGMEGGQSSPSGCRRPELGAVDPNRVPLAGDPYLTSRNPFVYFHSLLDGGACSSDDVDLAHLASDLATPTATPSLSWIVPSACDDGSATPCALGAAAGLGPADAFLRVVVPQILATAAYRQGGLIAIVPDSAPSSSGSAASRPVGALLLSPFVRSGARVSENLNDFSLLKSLTRLFGVLPLGHANDPSAVSFGATVYRTTK